MSDEELITRVKAGWKTPDGWQEINALLRELRTLRRVLTQARAVCREAGITTRELAVRCGVTAFELSRMTCNENSGPPDFID